MDKRYAKELQNKEQMFQESSSYNGSINLIMITVVGVKRNKYYDEVVTDDFTIDLLFVI